MGTLALRVDERRLLTGVPVVFKDNFSADAPHNNKYREELDPSGTLVLYAIGSVIVMLLAVWALLRWM